MSDPGPDRALARPFSASQITLWRSCERAWYYRYVEGRRTPPTASQALGTAVHKALELYYQGVPLPMGTEAGRRALPVLEHAPPRGPGLTTEQRIDLEYVDPANPNGPPLPFVGYVDLLAEIRDPDGLPVGIQVYDYKTTSGEQWAKTADDLAEDVQGNLYADWVFQQEPGAGVVPATWLYTLTRGTPKAWPVHHVYRREQTANVVSGIVQDASRIRLKLLAQTPEAGYATNTASCPAYGGCPYSQAKGGPCKPTQTLGDYLMTSSPNAAPTMSPELANLMAQFQQMTQAQPAPAAAPAPTPVAPGPLASFLLPPEAASPAAQALPVSAPPVADPMPPAGFAESSEVTQVATPQAAANAKRGPGRPRKAAPAQTGAPAPVEAPPPATAATAVYEGSEAPSFGDRLDRALAAFCRAYLEG